MKKVAVRYGPSPTGIPHVGNIRTALYNFLFAKSQNGEFFLRIEDTDQARIVKGAVEKIQQSLKLLNINWDGEIIYQSKRLSIYKKHLDILKEKGFAYEDEGAWRFKINTKNEKIIWQDAVHGEVSFPTNVLEDFVIIKSDGFPTYHFASVVDDHSMEISHVMRGDEWISSTPKHIQLYEAFSWGPPIFVHLPPILGANHKKLSKREGAKSVIEYIIEEGYLSEALVNFLALLGWAPKNNQEIFSLDDLIKGFSLDRINKNSPVFNLEKLNWINKQWIKKTDKQNLAQKIYKLNPQLEIKNVIDLLPLVQERMTTLLDFKNLTKMFFEKEINIGPLIGSIPVSGATLSHQAQVLDNIAVTDWVKVKIEDAIEQVTDEEKIERKDLLKSIGISVSASTVTPPLFDSLEKLGKEQTIKRLKAVAEKIKK